MTPNNSLKIPKKVYPTDEDYELEKSDFITSHMVLDKYGLKVQNNPYPLCIADKSLIKFMNQDKYKNNSPDGLNEMDMLKDLSVLLNLKCMSFLEYTGELISKWINDNEDRFSWMDKDDYDRLSRDAYVYVNHWYKKDYENNKGFMEEMGIEDKYGDNMGWFWVGEY